ncbi:MAG: hypothetical protein F4106_08985, partial [Gemmatimonadetes bacterium]|nr:hypothetical protein [Gemmatimonadota bacterium]
MRLSTLPRTLAAKFGPVESAVPDPRRKNAAVALILRPRADGDDPAVRQCEILAIRRAASDGDPSSGQMALPGRRL